MAVLRYKYRSAAIQPELSQARENVTLSLAKKHKPIEEDPYGTDNAPQRKEDPIFLATHTQVKRQELLIKSNEAAFRKEAYPTIFERIELQRDWVLLQQREARVDAEREAVALKIDKLAREAKGEHVSELEDSLLDDIDEHLRQIAGEDEADEEQNKQKATANEYREQLMAIKERKVAATRDTAQYHQEYTPWERRKRAFKISIGLIGRQRPDCTEILPWLLLGRKELASNMQSLLQLNITHILNMTHDVPNAFVKHFVYEKVPIRDSIDADVAAYFDTIINFIDRAHASQGRILVHCNAGASRAPTAVIAYLFAKKNITLDDAHNYVARMRPVVYPNKRFLFQLAMLEVKLFNSCSVYFNPRWRFYEFNIFRTQGVEERERLGMFKTVTTLYSKIEEEEDYFAQLQSQ